MTKLVGSLSWLRLGIAVGFMAVSATGCGGCDGNSLVCDENGQHCQICDGYGCHPANANVGGSGGGGSMGTAGGGTGGSGGSACDPATTTCPCDANGKCADGKACIDGLCVAGCNFTYQCGPDKVCADGACVAGCDIDHPCPAGYTCDSGACLLDPTNPACSTTNPCPQGQICGANGQCTTQCALNSDCAKGEICDSVTGQCIADPSPTPICDPNQPCPAPQMCLSDGFCHYPCNTLTDCQHIDNRFVACDLLDGQKVCLTDEEANPECSLTKPCPAGQTCISNKCQP